MTTEPKACAENVRHPIVLVSPTGGRFVTDAAGVAPSGPCGKPKADHCNLLAPMLPAGHTLVCKLIHGHAFVGEE